MKVKNPDVAVESQDVPKVTIRQLEAFSAVCQEGSYQNAAIELGSNRTTVRRHCMDFEKIVGRDLLETGADGSLHPGALAVELLAKAGPLCRAMHLLKVRVKELHGKRRILRLGAAGRFFQSNVLSHFLRDLPILNGFRPCFVMIEPRDAAKAIIQGACDVYFRLGRGAEKRFEVIEMKRVPWQMSDCDGLPVRLPDQPSELPAGKWRILEEGPGAQEILAGFHAAGARDGRVTTVEKQGELPAGSVFLRCDTGEGARSAPDAWPCFNFQALFRKNHPYQELRGFLAGVPK
ncbi:MAG: LysR family transcriptional regulator [Verrucomicrobiota bacterium]